jgi:hypothetical protein
LGRFWPGSACPCQPTFDDDRFQNARTSSS